MLKICRYNPASTGCMPVDESLAEGVTAGTIEIAYIFAAVPYTHVQTYVSDADTHGRQRSMNRV